ncbi:unnamed protein product, partial [Phaeothamnion confervicola]
RRRGSCVTSGTGLPSGWACAALSSCSLFRYSLSNAERMGTQKDRERRINSLAEVVQQMGFPFRNTNIHSDNRRLFPLHSFSLQLLKTFLSSRRVVSRPLVRCGHRLLPTPVSAAA